jgi:hypothetical protein
LRVVNAESGAVIVFEVSFGEVTVQMGLADVVELAVDGAFEQRKERLDGIGVMKPASADILLI